MKLQDLSLYFRLPNQKKKYIFNRINFQFPSSGMVVITGDSGVGKSSLLKVIANVYKPTTGKVIIPQYDKKYPPIYLSDQLALIPNWKGIDYLPTSQQQSQWIKLGMTESDLQKSYSQLSIGQQVRLKILLFFQQAACAYLLDEPTHALDEVNRDKVVDYLKIQADHQLLVIATHDSTLIQHSHIEIKMQSAHQMLFIHHQDSQSNKLKKITNQEPKNQSFRRWFLLIEKLNPANWIGLIISSAIWLIQIALFLISTLTFQLQSQSHQFQEQLLSDPWIEVVEVQNIPIHDSPFQLVKTLIPKQENFNVFLNNITPPLWLTDISNWFPKTIVINQIEVSIRFVDLPFDSTRLSTGWIYPYDLRPDSITLSTLALPNLIHPLTYHGPTLEWFHRLPTSWFEPPQLMLSYWQWLSILTQQVTWIDGQITNYLSAYLTYSPPTNGLLFIPNSSQRKELKALSNHPWRFSMPTEKIYPLIKPLLRPLLSFLPMFTITLLGIWMILWWSKLHWIYQQNYRHWQWLIALHQPFKKIWYHLTQRTRLNFSLMSVGTFSGLTYVIIFQQIMARPSIWLMLLLQIIWWLSFEMLSWLISKMFNYV